MINNWQTYFFKELEKNAAGMGLLANTALNAAFGLQGMASLSKENKQKMTLDSSRQQEEMLQLPGTSGLKFEGGKRIDPISNSAVNKF